MIRLEDFVTSFTTSPLTPWASAEPWELTSRSEDVAIHSTAVVESGAEPAATSSGQLSAIIVALGRTP